MKFNSNEELIQYLNSLKGYDGYIQFSHRRIKDIDIFFGSINIKSEDGFIYEAHFFDGKDSIAIKQVNNSFFISKTNIENAEIEEYFSKIPKLKVKIAQIWEDEDDKFCEGMRVKKLKKVVFAGFKKNENKSFVEKDKIEKLRFKIEHIKEIQLKNKFQKIDESAKIMFEELCKKRTNQKAFNKAKDRFIKKWSKEKEHKNSPYVLELLEKVNKGSFKC